MDGRSLRILTFGVVLGGLTAAFAIGGTAAAWGWRAGAAARGHEAIAFPVRTVQDEIPQQTPGLNPKEFIPTPGIGPAPGPGLQPAPGAGQQNCNQILFFYQGRLYQLRPGPMPKNGGNPEFFFMQPYSGPQIPGFPGLNPGGPPLPALPGETIPPTFKF